LLKRTEADITLNEYTVGHLIVAKHTK